MSSLHVDSDDYKDFAAKLKAADKALQSEIRQQLRELGREMGREVLEAGAAPMPRRGGLAAYLARRGRVGVSITGTRLELSLGVPKKSLVATLDESGSLRHPVFGRRVYADQKVPSSTWTDAFLARKAEMVERMQTAVDKALRRLT